MELNFKLLNRIELAKLEKDMRFFYDVSFKSGTALYLDLVRKQSSRHIVRNSNPSRPWAQSTTDGHLTTRTGATQRAIQEGGNNKTAWGSFDKKTVKTNPSILKTFAGVVKSTGTGVDAYWSIFVRDGSAALAQYVRSVTKAKRGTSVDDMSKLQRKLKQAKLQIYWRLRWEQRGRPFLSRANDEVQGQYNAIMRKSFGEGLINKLRLN